MQKDGIQPGQNVIVVDDLIATGGGRPCLHAALLIHIPLGGSAKAAGELVEKQGGIVLEYLFIVEVLGLSRDWQHDKAPIYSIIQYS